MTSRHIAGRATRRRRVSRPSRSRSRRRSSRSGSRRRRGSWIGCERAGSIRRSGRARRCWSFTPDGSASGPWARYVHDPLSRGIGTVRYPRRVPNSDEAARELAKRTLTNLYNQRPTWLALAHQKLDSAVFAAYGWPDTLTYDEILERLLSLNLHRAAAK